MPALLGSSQQEKRRHFVSGGFGPSLGANFFNQASIVVGQRVYIYIYVYMIYVLKRLKKGSSLLKIHTFWPTLLEGQME